MAADLDEHIGLWDVDAVVAHLGQEQRVDLRRMRQTRLYVFCLHCCIGVVVHAE